MAFVNKKVFDQDRKRISSVINYENLSAISRWIHRFSEPAYWTVDDERGAYLINLGGGGSPDDKGRMPYRVLGVGDQVVLFNVVDKSKGNHAEGVQSYLEVYDTHIPPALEQRREEIKQLIREGLEEAEFFSPFSDGGTVANPNTVTRSNIVSFNVEFK